MAGEWIKIGESDVFDRTNRVHAKVGGRYVSAIRSRSGKIFCIDAICYHAGGPLTMGDIEEIDGHTCVKCPWHHYAIKLEDGKKMSQGLSVVNGKMVPTGWQVTPRPLQRTHEVRFRENDGLYVRLSSKDRESGEIRSDGYAYNDAAGEHIVRGSSARAGSDGVRGQNNMKADSKPRVPSGRVFRHGAARPGRQRGRVTERSSGRLKFRVEAPIETVVEGDDAGAATDERPRGRRVLLEPGHSDIDWARAHSRMRPIVEGERLREIDRDELRRHRSAEDAWIAIRGKVYDVTPYLRFHPGGVEEILRAAGDDATRIFDEVHRWVQADHMLNKLCVGVLAPKKRGASELFSRTLNDHEWCPFRVVARTIVAKRTIRMTLRTDSSVVVPVGQHVQLSVARSNGSLGPYRAYTPIAVRPERGEMDFVIKIYRDGMLTPKLGSLQVSNLIYVRGPRGTLRYVGPGTFRLAGKANEPARELCAKRVNMIAGGTGLTPMLQIARCVATNDADATRIRLLVVNRNLDDVMLREEMCREFDREESNVEVAYTLTGRRVSDEWRGLRGRVDVEMLRRACYSADSDPFTLVCGPPGFNHAVRQLLLKTGHDGRRVHVF